MPNHSSSVTRHPKPPATPSTALTKTPKPELKRSQTAPAAPLSGHHLALERARQTVKAARERDKLKKIIDKNNEYVKLIEKEDEVIVEDRHKGSEHKIISHFRNDGSTKIVTISKDTDKTSVERFSASGHRSVTEFNSHTLAARAIFKPAQGPAIAASVNPGELKAAVGISTGENGAAVELDPQGIHVSVKTPVSALSGSFTVPYKVAGEVITAVATKGKKLPG